ncbi:uncharacterized protein IL334_002084 [Kwoniella shivajii]|uniref:Glycosyltransferase family 31 protein n=1 Tax=Kwoniella shivajii TaxID=564305 RepID=A0ABZ1CXV8_9TREE|nr:hypothetical protein IL334_002084 [Kwoniella shivajii]
MIQQDIITNNDPSIVLHENTDKDITSVDNNNNNNSSSTTTDKENDQDKDEKSILTQANIPAGIQIIPPSPSPSPSTSTLTSTPISNFNPPTTTNRKAVSSSTNPSSSSSGAIAGTALQNGDRTQHHNPASSSSASASSSATASYRIPPTKTSRPTTNGQQSYPHSRHITRKPSSHIQPQYQPQSQSQHPDYSNSNNNSNQNNNSLKRVSIDDNNHHNHFYSITTSSDVYTPTQENGHFGITRRRQSISTPNNNSNNNSNNSNTNNPYSSPKRQQSSGLKSPPVVPSSSSTLGWLTGNRLTLPPNNNKHSKSDDEREDIDEEEDSHSNTSTNTNTNTNTIRKQKKWDWRMSNNLPNYGESSRSGSASASTSSSLMNTPLISMTPPSATDSGYMPPPLPVNNFNYSNTSPPRTSILPSQAPLGSSLQPLAQDPNNILPLSLASSPFTSPAPSRAPTPLHSPYPSLQDLASEYAASAAPVPSGSGSSPRTSISTSSSRYGWGTGRSDSRSSEEEESSGPITTSHRPVTTSGWWQHQHVDIPVSPKVNLSSSVPPRLLRMSSATASKFIPTGTRNWGWLFGMVRDRLTNGGSSSLTRRTESTGRKNSISAKARNRERERLMSGSISRVGRKRDQKVLGSKKLARIMAFVPTEPWSISLFLIFFVAFAVTMTFTIKHILNPDKEPLPWQQYCTSNYPTLYSLQDPFLPPPYVNSDVNSNPSFPSSQHIESVPVNSFAPSSSKSLTLMPLTPEHPAWPYHPHSTPPNMTVAELDETIDPVGILIGVFTTDVGLERRHMIRQSYASHWRSRKEGTEGVRIRFVMGRPRKRFEKAVRLEMEAFNDILLLDMDENMNSGKTHAFFSWAAENATVPSWEYPKHEGLSESMSEQGDRSRPAPIWKGERKPNYVVKADEDAFIMLGELEKKLRVVPRTKAFWGYLVKNTFMAGECYALSFDLVQYIHASPALRTLTRGKEDKLVAKWMNMHPEREQIVWATERCWIYDHPKAGTVYSHGFLFPSAVAGVRSENQTGISPSALALRGGLIQADSYSTVSKFGVAYKPISVHMSVPEQVEALIEGSPLSLLRDQQHQSKSSSPDTQHDQRQVYSEVDNVRAKIDRAYNDRPSRKERFLGDQDENGGTVVVHYLKRNDWFIETMVALLGSSEDQDTWHRGVGTGLGALERRKGRVVNIDIDKNTRVENDNNNGIEMEFEDEDEEGLKLSKGEGL